MSGVLAIDDLFSKMFKSGPSRNQVPHPLMHMAWANWCSRFNSSRHMSYLMGGETRGEDDIGRLFQDVQSELVIPYLFPNPARLSALVRALIDVLYTWTSDSHNAVFDGEYGQRLKEHNTELYGAQRDQFLDNIRKAVTGGFFKWEESEDNQPDPKHFKDFETLWKFSDQICRRIWKSTHLGILYSPEAAKHLLGDPKEGWAPTRLIGTLMRPICSLVGWVAAEDQRLGGDLFGMGRMTEVDRNPPYGTGLTPFGQLHQDLAKFEVMGDKLGVAHFLIPPPNARYGKRHNDQKVKDTQLKQYGTAHTYLQGGSVQTRDFRELLALAGYKYAVWTRPTVLDLGVALATDSVPAPNFLRTRSGVNRRNHQRLIVEPLETVDTMAWDALKVHMEREEFARQTRLTLAAEDEPVPDRVPKADEGRAREFGDLWKDGGIKPDGTGRAFSGVSAIGIGLLAGAVVWLASSR